MQTGHTTNARLHHHVTSSSDLQLPVLSSPKWYALSLSDTLKQESQVSLLFQYWADALFGDGMFLPLDWEQCSAPVLVAFGCQCQVIALGLPSRGSAIIFKYALWGEGIRIAYAHAQSQNTILASHCVTNSEPIKALLLNLVSDRLRQTDGIRNPVGARQKVPRKLHPWACLNDV